MGWEAGDQMEKGLREERERLEQEKITAEKEADLIRSKAGLLKRFENGETEITGTLDIDNSGNLEFEDGTSQEAVNSTWLVYSFAIGETPEEFMEAARKIQDEGIAQFTFERDSTGRKLSYTIRPGEQDS